MMRPQTRASEHLAQQASLSDRSTKTVQCRVKAQVKSYPLVRAMWTKRIMTMKKVGVVWMTT